MEEQIQLDPVVQQEQLARRQKVLDKLNEWGIPYTMYEHPPLPTIELALEYWKNIDSTHCKNLFFRNHKGNKHSNRNHYAPAEYFVLDTGAELHHCRRHHAHHQHRC